MCYSNCPYEHSFTGECRSSRFCGMPDAHCYIDAHRDEEGELTCESTFSQPANDGQPWEAPPPSLPGDALPASHRTLPGHRSEPAGTIERKS